jgi:hypothetical protein
MNDRLSQQVEHNLKSTLEGLQHDLAELKSRQPTASSLVKRSFTSQTSNTFDIVAHSIPANTVRYFYLTFTGDGTQPQPYGIQYCQIYNNGTSSGNRLSDYQQRDITGTYYFSSATRPSPFIGPNKMTWIIGVSAGASGASIYLKIRVMASCKGTALELTF